jgi:mono/diheme cytochrome c family protein
MRRPRRSIATLRVAGIAGLAGVTAAVCAAALTRVAPPPRADAAALYAEHCAGCHGKEGHGDGPTAAELKFRPRDFKAGSFAFGNTTEAMVKTILAGIPGEETARMPPFKGILTVAEIESVVELVRTMMPRELLPTAAEMKLTPSDRPLFVRGLLAPFKDGDPPIARGLLVGSPDGFSFEYATDGVRLLAVRRGEFATRSDWEGRGGRPLTPLGEVVFKALTPPQWSPFLLRPRHDSGDGDPAAPLTARLRSTSSRGGVAELDFDLVEPGGGVLGRVRERPRGVVVPGGAGIVEEFEIKAAGPAPIVLSLLLASDPALPLPLREAVKPRDVAAVRHLEEQSELARETGWYVVRSTPTVTLAVRFDLPAGASADTWSGADSDAIDVSCTTGARPSTLRRTVVACGAVTIESLEKMTKELR